MIDPAGRWANPEQKPPYAGLATFAELPWTEDAAGLADVDAAIVGAPFDALAGDRPGSREGPRAIRVASRPLGPEVGTGVDPMDELRLVDYGDAPVVPYEIEATRAAIERTVAEVIAAGAVAVTLGGDHSITLPALRACAAKHGALGLVHFDAHTDTGTDSYGHPDNHGTMMRRLVDEGMVDPGRYVQIGLRGGWPGAETFAWQAEAGITHFTADVVRRRGIDEIVAEAVVLADPGPAYLSIDIDVLDPVFAGRTGTPEVGGLHARELVAAARRLGEALDLRGMDLVETVPGGWGTGDPAPLYAAGVIDAALTGMAARQAA